MEVNRLWTNLQLYRKLAHLSLEAISFTYFHLFVSVRYLTKGRKFVLFVLGNDYSFVTRIISNRIMNKEIKFKISLLAKFRTVLFCQKYQNLMKQSLNYLRSTPMD